MMYMVMCYVVLWVLCAMLTFSLSTRLIRPTNICTARLVTSMLSCYDWSAMALSSFVLWPLMAVQLICIAAYKAFVVIWKDGALELVMTSFLVDREKRASVLHNDISDAVYSIGVDGMKDNAVANTIVEARNALSSGTINGSDLTETERQVKDCVNTALSLAIANRRKALYEKKKLVDVRA